MSSNTMQRPSKFDPPAEPIVDPVDKIQNKLEEDLLDAGNHLLAHMGAEAIMLPSRHDNDMVVIVATRDRAAALLGFEEVATVVRTTAWFSQVESPPEVSLAPGSKLYRRTS